MYEQYYFNPFFLSHVKFIRGKFRDPVRLQVWIDYNFLARIEIKLRNYVVNTLDENKNIFWNSLNDKHYREQNKIKNK